MEPRKAKLIDSFNLDASHFELNAIFRGAQLTLVGAYRALQNPDLFTAEYYKQAIYAVLAGLGIRLLVAIPIIAARLVLWFTSLLYPRDQVSWEDSVTDWLNFMGDSVLQLPFFLMMVMRHVVPTLDNLAGLSIVVLALSYTPIFGQLILPLVSFYTFHKSVGLGPASIIFGSGLFLPRRYLIIFLQSYYSSRNLMNELLEPYFTRVQFSREEKRNWFRSREGVLFGFGLGFYVLSRVPLFGVLVYGIAEASTAYLVTKITDPPPPPSDIGDFARSQQTWRNKHEFLSLNLLTMDDMQTGPALTPREKQDALSL
ncbi:transmembrane protein UsgS, partial [Metarhizium brunneum ARSEF 3297]